ncbi:hypothetical protein ABZ897_01085 [Nonomuraea sp. NPDC046802]|uniref:hypothetical protein n=1 Tax=Nonomuraea sp. NPDC046802 TaxID=3154919 RepID=UPI0033DB9516
MTALPADQTATTEAATAPEARKPLQLFRSKAEREADKARARAVAAKAAIEEQRARDQIALERLEAEREMTKVRNELAENAKQKQDKAAADRRTFRQRISRAVVLASANVGVNAVAVLGQVLALTLGLGWDWWAAVPLALVVESVAVNVGYIAHDKLINGYSAGWLRFLSYGIGAAVGWFNYDHNSGTTVAANGVEATVPTADYAVVFGAASVLSPVLWQIYSQWKHWQQLREQGLLEARAPKFAKLRWIIPSLRGETWQAFKVAIAEGIQTPEVAIAEVRSRTAAGTAQELARQAREALVATQADALRLALAQLAAVFHDLDGEDPKGAEARKSIAAFVARFQPFIPPLELTPPVPEDPENPDDLEPDPEPAKNPRRPSDEDNRKTVQRIIRTIRAGKPVPAKAEVAGWRGFSPKWGWDRVQDAKSELVSEGWTFPERDQPIPPPGSEPVPSRSLNGSTSAPTGDQS